MKLALALVCAIALGFPTFAQAQPGPSTSYPVILGQNI